MTILFMEYSVIAICMQLSYAIFRKYHGQLFTRHLRSGVIYAAVWEQLDKPTLANARFFQILPNEYEKLIRAKTRMAAQSIMHSMCQCNYK